MSTQENPFGFEIALDTVQGTKYGAVSNKASQVVKLHTDGGVEGLDKVMGGNYRPMKVAEFLQHVYKFQDVGDFEDPKFYHDGRARIFAFLPIKEGGSWSLNGSVMKNSMTIANSFDGSMPFTIGSNSHFYRCNNMYTSMQNKMKIRNSIHSMQAHLDEFKFELDNYFQNLSNFESTIEKFQQSENQFEISDKLKKELLGIPYDLDIQVKGENLKKEISTQKVNQLIKLEDSITRETVDIGNSIWGLFNGVTHYTSHEKGGLDTYGTSSIPQKINDKAYNMLAELV